MRRDFDTINPKTHPFIIVSSPETEKDAHPFWYAAVLGVFHADVQHAGDDSRDFRFKKMEFLWVRWLGVVPGHSFGQRQAKLPKIGFVPDSDEFAFGFLDPSHVVRGCHLIPSFKDGKTQDLLTTDLQGESLGRVGTEGDDWANYYVGMYVNRHQQTNQLLTVSSSLYSFVDRDMFMRFLGIGIGHRSQHSVRAEEVDDSQTFSIDDDESDDGVEDTDCDDENEDDDTLDDDTLDDEDEDPDSVEEIFDDDDLGYDDL
jgi:hypothetical protein